jgi:tetratricopeptide (TPR) repeat protein
MVAAVAAAATGLRAFEANRDGFRARLDSDTGQALGGLEFARAAISLDDGRADYWNELGRAYFAAAEWQESADAFQGAIARAPQQATYRSNLAKSLTQLALTGGGSADAAAEAGRQAVQVDPNSPVPYVALAEVLSALKQPDDALQAIVNAIRLFPGPPRFETIAAAAARDATDLPVARRALTDAIAARDSATLRVALGQLALKQGDREAALANGRRALELDPTNAEAMALVRAAS